jgi:hypothetical protein
MTTTKIANAQYMSRGPHFNPRDAFVEWAEAHGLEVQWGWLEGGQFRVGEHPQLPFAAAAEVPDGLLGEALAFDGATRIPYNEDPYLQGEDE